VDSLEGLVLTVWAAGFFDGEGCVQLSLDGSSLKRRLIVTNCDPRPLLKLQHLFKGKVSSNSSNKKRNPEHRNSFLWNVYSTNAEKAAEQLLPFSVTKKEQLQLFLEACRVFARTAASAERQATLQAYLRQLKLERSKEWF
jgi:hypothetical protein